MPTGTVKFYVGQRGFGFIKPDDGSADVFVHISRCDYTIDALIAGQRVEFELGRSTKNGKLEAKQVKVAK